MSESTSTQPESSEQVIKTWEKLIEASKNATNMEINDLDLQVSYQVIGELLNKVENENSIEDIKKLGLSGLAKMTDQQVKDLSKRLGNVEPNKTITLHQLCKFSDELSTNSFNKLLIDTFGPEVVSETPKVSLDQSADILYYYGFSENPPENVTREITVNNKKIKVFDGGGIKTYLEGELTTVLEAIRNEIIAKGKTKKVKTKDIKDTKGIIVDTQEQQGSANGKIDITGKILEIINMTTKDKLGKALDLSGEFSQIFSKIKYNESGEPTNLVELMANAKTIANKRIVDYSAQLDGKPIDIIKRELTDEKKAELINDIPKEYLGTKYAKLYVAKLKEGAFLKSFDDFINEDVKMSGLERLMFMLKRLFSNLMGQFNEITGKDTEESDKKEADARQKDLDGLYKSAGVNIDKMNADKELAANKVRVKNFLKKTKGKWSEINISDVYGRTMEGNIDNKCIDYFTQAAHIEELDTFEAEFLDVSKEPIKTARTKGFKMKTLRNLQSAEGVDGVANIDFSRITKNKLLEKKLIELKDLSAQKEVDQTAAEELNTKNKELAKRIKNSLSRTANYTVDWEDEKTFFIEDEKIKIDQKGGDGIFDLIPYEATLKLEEGENVIDLLTHLNKNKDKIKNKFNKI